jgi:hypothetical protein
MPQYLDDDSRGRLARMRALSEDPEVRALHVITRGKLAEGITLGSSRALRRWLATRRSRAVSGGRERRGEYV